MTCASSQAHAVGVRSPLKLEYWIANLKNHPDQAFVSRIIHQIIHGIPIGYQGNEFYLVSDNWPSAEKYHEQVRDFIMVNSAKGRIDGPYLNPPHKFFRGSPLGAVPKKQSSPLSVRVIHDLSWPPGKSINEFINKYDYTFSYATIDQAARMCLKYKTPWMCKVDVKDAYMHCAVRHEDQHLLGFTWINEQGVTEYWQMCVLPFGLSSSPKLFDDYAECLLYMMKNNGASEDSIHYCDDFFSVNGSEQDSTMTLNVMEDTIDDSGMEVQVKKRVPPARCMEFVGIIIDTIDWVLRISPERLTDIKAELLQWGQKKVCSKRELLSLMGKLIFCSKVIRDGRKFVGRLIDLSKKVHHLHHKVKLNKEARADIEWWLRSMEDHNGISMFPTDWNIDESIVIYSDASDLAAGGICGDSWFVVPFTGVNAWMSKMDIAWRELYAAVVCVATFSDILTGKRVSMQIDNQAVYWSINNGKSKNPKLMSLIRSLYYYTTKYNIDYKAFYLPTDENTIADAISRLEFDRLRDLRESIQVSPRVPAKILLDF